MLKNYLQFLPIIFFFNLNVFARRWQRYLHLRRVVLLEIVGERARFQETVRCEQKQTNAENQNKEKRDFDDPVYSSYQGGCGVLTRWTSLRYETRVYLSSFK